ncbi:MAG: SDR family oxidoreductase [Nitrospinae bacterium]|nr:SDR family oxidoreductase [Nitrospinota bacterium]
MKQFTGRRIIVTGGTRGIGKAVAEAFLAEGAHVTSLYGGNDTAARAMTEALPDDQRSRFETAKVDVADYAACEAFMGEWEKRHDTLDVLVNNAGIRRDGVVGMMPADDWNAVIDVNLTGTFNMSKLAVRVMMRKRYGRIVNMTSPIGVFAFAGQANYAASKAGQVALTKSLAKEVASRKITVNCVSPGFIDTDFIADLPDEQRTAYQKQVPMRRFGTAAEVADSVLFLSGERAAYISGAVLEITGGL